jgi:TolB protein
MNANGTGQTNLTQSAHQEYELAWSEDGSKIEFVQGVTASDYEIWTMDADGSNPENVTNSPAMDNTPRSSPDGTHFLFGTDRDGDKELYATPISGTGAADVTNNAADDIDGDWTSCP